LRRIHITRGLEQVVGARNKEENNLIIIDNGSRERRENLGIDTKAGINKLTAEIAHEKKYYIVIVQMIINKPKRLLVLQVIVLHFENCTTPLSLVQ
jgi:hypothetical protein